jgi:hypothetical protein
LEQETKGFLEQEQQSFSKDGILSLFDGKSSYSYGQNISCLRSSAIIPERKPQELDFQSLLPAVQEPSYKTSSNLQQSDKKRSTYDEHFANLLPKNFSTNIC